MPILIVERSFAEPLDGERTQRLFEKLGPCLEQSDVDWVHSYVSSDGSRMFCAFRAADAETVRLAHRMAKVEFDRVWAADRLAPGDG